VIGKNVEWTIYDTIWVFLTPFGMGCIFLYLGFSTVGVVFILAGFVMILILVVYKIHHSRGPEPHEPYHLTYE